VDDAGLAGFHHPLCLFRRDQVRNGASRHGQALEHVAQGVTAPDLTLEGVEQAGAQAF